MTGRRAILLAALGAGTLPPSLAFTVRRNSRRIGRHALEFSAVPEGFDIAIAVDIAVGLGPVTLFRYRLRGEEHWRGGQCVAARFACHNNGREQWMRCTRAPDGLLVEGSAGAPYLAPPEALPATHWNPAELAGPWIHPQDGTLLRPAVGPADATPPPFPAPPARRYALSGEATMELWYGTDGTWVALRAPGKDGSTITYQPE